MNSVGEGDATTVPLDVLAPEHAVLLLPAHRVAAATGPVRLCDCLSVALRAAPPPYTDVAVRATREVPIVRHLGDSGQSDGWDVAPASGWCASRVER